jgi:hypothetical protein
LANPVIAKFGTSLVLTLEDELLERLDDEELEERLDDDNEAITLTLTLEDELLDELEDRLDDDENTVLEVDEELLLDELLLELDDKLMIEDEDADTPQLPATALPLTDIESILAISCEPVARIRNWFTPAAKVTVLLTLLQVDKAPVRGNDKLPEEPLTVRPALVDPIFA